MVESIESQIQMSYSGVTEEDNPVNINVSLDGTYSNPLKWTTAIDAYINFLRNIGYGITEEDLEEHFQTFNEEDKFL